MRSGRLAGKDALRRVGETGAWWLGCTSPGGMARDGEGWRLSVHVRVMHGFVNHQLERADDWDWDLRGVPINAVDQAATIGTFSTSYLLHARLLGIRVSRSDARAIMHLLVVRRLADGRGAAVAAAHRAGRPAGALPVRVDRPRARRERPGARRRADGDDRPLRRGRRVARCAGDASGH